MADEISEILTFQPVTEENWTQMQKLFGNKGAYGGCWCTYWRMKRSEFNSLSSEDRKERMATIIHSGVSPGIVAFLDGVPIGWCSFGKRDEFPLLENSRTLKRVDDKDVLSIVCFYIERKHRRQGVMKSLLKEVIRIAETGGIPIVEGYPVDPASQSYPDPFSYTGLLSAFVNTGFVEVARRSEKRPVMRYYTSSTK